MKKVILFLQVLIFFISGFGQGNPAIKIINLDFKDKTLTLPDDNAKGKVYQIHITNFNPFYYKAVINSSDSSVQIPVNANFSKLIDPTGISSLAEFLIPSASTSEKVNKSEVSDFLNTHISKMSEYSGELLQQVSSLNNQIIPINKEIDNLIRFNKQTGRNFDSMENEIIASLNHFDNLISRIKTDQKKYLQFALSKNEEISNSKELQALDEQIKKSYTNLIDEAYKVKKEFNELNVYKLIATVKEYREVKNTFTSLPIYSRKDISNITIEIIPRKENEPAYAQSYKTSFSLPQNQKQIWGVSGGVYISTLKNELYEIDSSSNSHYVIENTESDKIEVGFNVMAYTGWRLRKSATFLGPSIGIGMSLESTPRPRVFLGPTLVTGENRRLEISAGIIAGKVYQLNSRYKNIESFTSIPLDFKKDRTKAGAFISIGYTFL